MKALIAVILGFVLFSSYPGVAQLSPSVGNSSDVFRRRACQEACPLQASSPDTGESRVAA